MVLLVLLGIVIFAALRVPAEAQSESAAPLDEGAQRLRVAASPTTVLRAGTATPAAAEELRQRLQRLRALKDEGRESGRVAAPGRFNDDTAGVPQNEGSLTSCAEDPEVVLGGTNDYRGAFEPDGNAIGWHFSDDGGASLTNEGRLPGVRIGRATVPSDSNSVMAADADCNLYAAGIATRATGGPRARTGIAVYRSDPERLASCVERVRCWPTRRAVAENEPGHLLDKPWFDVGPSGDDGTVVWVAYLDLNIAPDPALGLPFTGSIKAVRCDRLLSSCSAPITVSGDDLDVQFADVTIGPDGRVYVTWVEFLGAIPDVGQQRNVLKLRVAEPGSETFGPERVIATEERPLTVNSKLRANDFRIATIPKHEVVATNGAPRIFVTWDACRERVFNAVGQRINYSCEEAVIKLTSSGDAGRTWAPIRELSTEGDNYFPTIAADEDGSPLAVAYYTTRSDPTWNSRQDVELVELDPRDGSIESRERITPTSNDPAADPLLGGTFIGDYFEIAVTGRRVLVHYTANYRRIRLLGEGLPVNQQDNYLARRNL